MTKAALKKQIHQYVDIADEKTLRMVKALLSEALDESDAMQSSLTKEQLAVLKQRVKNFKEQETKQFSLSEVKEMARAAK